MLAIARIPFISSSTATRSVSDTGKWLSPWNNPIGETRPDFGRRPYVRWRENGRIRLRGPAYFGLILVILLPCMPSPAMSPFWPKMKA